MAKTKSKIDRSIVDGLKGVLDFYPRGNETIIRRWPVNRGASQTPRSVPWQRVFACFHHYWTGMWIGGPPDVHRSLLGKSWTRRDYTMWLYYGKSPRPPDLLPDLRDPWPPPCPDPLNRFALFNRPTATYSIFSGVNLYYSRHPAGPTVVSYTYELPRYQRRYAIERGQRHEIGAAIAPPDSPMTEADGRIHASPYGTNRARFFRVLNRRFYFFIYPYTLLHKRTMSMSPWYVALVRPGPTGTEWGATIDGPLDLGIDHLVHPDRPLRPGD